MTHGSQITLMDGAVSGSDRERTWALARSALPGGRTFRARAGTPTDRAVLARATAEARAALEEAVVAAAVAAERARSMAAVLEEALAGLEAVETAPPPAPAAKSPGRVYALSPREREVLALVAEGRSNKAIAAELFVSPNTIKTHVASLFSKLHAGSRVQLAAMAARQGA